MVNYSLGKIYKLQNKNNPESDIYIGSTTHLRLCQRFAEHKNTFNRFKKGLTITNYSSHDIFRKYGTDNCEIILIENVNAQNKDELKAKERQYILNNNCVNKQIPQTKEDWKEYTRSYNKEYRQTENQKLKDTIVFNCDCGKHYTRKHKTRHFNTFKHLQFELLKLCIM